MAMVMASSQPAQVLVVRKTFIEVEEEPVESSSRRRCSSLPPSQRFQEATACFKKCLPSEDGASDTEASTEAFSDSGSEAGSGSSTTVSQATASGRSKLKSSARAWQPGEGQVPCQLMVRDNFMQEVANLILHIQGILVAAGVAKSVEVVEDWQGWHVQLVIPQEASQKTEGLLTLAKQGMLQWAECSSLTYVLGYCAQPFVPQLNGGFVATLGAMEDSSCACWDFYRFGCCKRMQLCRWQHPQRAVLFHLDVVYA
eukprot:TRINITY_DN109352_c0_g1_i1.p1 TRINITY_DN109352_c0_g1~~TRINITY_DN109352_c0_g1_i1.p1  ORF type:complete len:256 (-),score=59.77 TRINITY_DN109352_c0_g1_i1:114-881(-)